MNNVTPMELNWKIIIIISKGPIIIIGKGHHGVLAVTTTRCRLARARSKQHFFFEAHRS